MPGLMQVPTTRAGRRHHAFGDAETFTCVPSTTMTVSSPSECSGVYGLDAANTFASFTAAISSV